MAMPNKFWQCQMKSFFIPKNKTSEGKLVQKFHLIGQEITSLDPLIFESVNKISFPNIYYIL